MPEAGRAADDCPHLSTAFPVAGDDWVTAGTRVRAHARERPPMRHRDRTRQQAASTPAGSTASARNRL